MPAYVFGSNFSDEVGEEIIEELENVNETLDNLLGSSVGTVGEVIVSNSSTLIRNTNTNRKAITIRNIGLQIVYITTGSVATLQGFPVDPEGVLEFEGYFGDITGITASGGSAVRYMEII